MSECGHKVLGRDELPKRRVTTVSVGHHTLAVTTPAKYGMNATCGASGFRVESIDQFGPILTEALTCIGESIVDIASDVSLV